MDKLNDRVKLARHLARQNAGPWHAVGREIFAPEEGSVLITRDPAVARYVAAVHNCFLPLSNLLLEAQKVLKDRTRTAAFLSGELADGRA